MKYRFRPTAQSNETYWIRLNEMEYSFRTDSSGTCMEICESLIWAIKTLGIPGLTKRQMSAKIGKGLSYIDITVRNPIRIETSDNISIEEQ